MELQSKMNRQNKEDLNNDKDKSCCLYQKPKIIKDNNLNPEIMALLNYKNKIRTKVYITFKEQLKYVYCNCKVRDDSPYKRYRYDLTLQADKEI